LDLKPELELWGERQLHNIADRTRSHPLDGDLAVAVGGKSTKASAIHARETPPTKGTRVPEVGARFSIDGEMSLLKQKHPQIFYHFEVEYKDGWDNVLRQLQREHADAIFKGQEIIKSKRRANKLQLIDK
tara:strand:- start:130 stop:519 length:390 start_codon:yes stop_codon:yes gene_type:complete